MENEKGNIKWLRIDLYDFVLDFLQNHGKMPKVFLSGAITNRLDTYKSHFDEAERNFSNIFIQSYNPSVIDIKTPWEVAMKETISQLKQCDFMFVLKNWENSKGVKIEIKKAKELKIPIFYE